MNVNNACNRWVTCLFVCGVIQNGNASEKRSNFFGIQFH